MTPLINTFTRLNNNLNIYLAVYIISAGGRSHLSDSFELQKFVFALRYIPKSLHKLLFLFMFESGFQVPTLIPYLQETNGDLKRYLFMLQKTSISLKRLAANVLRIKLVPNAWVGLKRLALPPAFDKQYIILNPMHEVALWLEETL